MEIPIGQNEDGKNKAEKHVLHKVVDKITNGDL
jgi:hypothetical protein